MISDQIDFFESDRFRSENFKKLTALLGTIASPSIVHKLFSFAVCLLTWHLFYQVLLHVESVSPFCGEGPTMLNADFYPSDHVHIALFHRLS